jgi:hypothetical protein
VGAELREKAKNVLAKWFGDELERRAFEELLGQRVITLKVKIDGLEYVRDPYWPTRRLHAGGE